MSDPSRLDRHRLTAAQLRRARESAEDMLELLRDVLAYGIPHFNDRIRAVVSRIHGEPKPKRRQS